MLLFTDLAEGRPEPLEHSLSAGANTPPIIAIFESW
jgi:hypothetical protein